MIEEHTAGWHVLLDGEHIADLDWLEVEDLNSSHFLFRLTPLVPDAGKIDYALRRTASRNTDLRVVLEHRVSGAFLADDQFFADLRDDSTVALRPMAHAELPSPSRYRQHAGPRPAAPRAAAKRTFSSAFSVAILFQALSGVLVFLPYDAEALVAMWLVSVIAFWIGAGMICSRHPHRPTRIDDFFVRWGSPILFMLVTPLLFYLVAEAGRFLQHLPHRY